jgi:hypothetical protein
MPKFRRLLLTVLVLLAALAFGAGSAAAKTPCWKTLLNDEWDGRIDGTYPVSCYREALKHLPEDVLVYGQAKNDLNRALLAAVAANGGEPPPPDTPVPPSEPTRSTQSHEDSKSWFQQVADKLGPGNATSIPLPLMILAGVGLLLVAAAGASVAARKIQARRTQPATVPPTPPTRGK